VAGAITLVLAVGYGALSVHQLITGRPHSFRTPTRTPAPESVSRGAWVGIGIAACAAWFGVGWLTTPSEDSVSAGTVLLSLVVVGLVLATMVAVGGLAEQAEEKQRAAGVSRPSAQVVLARLPWRLGSSLGTSLIVAAAGSLFVALHPLPPWFLVVVWFSVPFEIRRTWTTRNVRRDADRTELPDGRTSQNESE
jgi:hypothetical protein